MARPAPSRSRDTTGAPSQIVAATGAIPGGDEPSLTRKIGRGCGIGRKVKGLSTPRTTGRHAAACGEPLLDGAVEVHRAGVSARTSHRLGADQRAGEPCCPGVWDVWDRSGRPPLSLRGLLEPSSGPLSPPSSFSFFYPRHPRQRRERRGESPGQRATRGCPGWLSRIPDNPRQASQTSGDGGSMVGPACPGCLGCAGSGCPGWRCLCAREEPPRPCDRSSPPTCWAATRGPRRGFVNI